MSMLKNVLSLLSVFFLVIFLNSVQAEARSRRQIAQAPVSTSPILVTQPCVESAPTLLYQNLSSVSESYPQQANYGIGQGYPLILKNNDSATCAARVFNLSASHSVNSNFINAVFLPSYQASISVTLAAGASIQVNANMEIGFGTISSGSVTFAAFSGSQSTAFISNYSIVAPASSCVLADPTLTLSAGLAATTYVTAGTLVDYAVNITTNDSAGCPERIFNLSAALGVGYSASLSRPSVSLSPNTQIPGLPARTAQVIVTLASPLNEQNGIASILLSASSGAQIGSLALNYNIYPQVCLRGRVKLLISPTAQSGSYALTAVNMSDASCGPLSMLLSATYGMLPAGFSLAFSSGSISDLSPGQASAPVAVQVTAPAGTAAGSYLIMITANVSQPGLSQNQALGSFLHVIP